MIDSELSYIDYESDLEVDFENDLVFSLNNQQIDELVEYINGNFSTLEVESKQLDNYRLLLKYLKLKKYSINEADADALFSRCPKLLNMMRVVCKLGIEENALVKGLFEVFDIRNFEERVLNRNLKTPIMTNRGKHDLNLIDLYYNEIKDMDIYSPEKEIEMFRRYHAGDSSAYEEIVNHNLKYVVNVAKKYNNFNLTLNDLIQEGNIGLMKAIDRFDETRGIKFSTYATWWIRQTILDAIKKTNRLIRVPNNTYSKIKNIQKYILDYFSENGTYPTDEQISTYFNISIEKVAILKRHYKDVSSLNEYVGEDEDETILDFIPDGNVSVETKVISNIMSSNIRNFILNTDVLTQREKEILYLRYAYGYSGGYIGKKYKISRQRVKQIEDKAFIKLRNNTDFLNLVPDKYLLSYKKVKMGNKFHYVKKR